MSIYNPKRKTEDGTDNIQFPINSIYGLEATEADNGKVFTVVNGKPKWKSKYSEGLSYTLNDRVEVYICSGIGTCTDTDIVIPPTHNGITVGVIGSSVFANTSVESVVLPDSVEEIQEYAFGYTANLHTVVIGKNVHTVGERIFYYNNGKATLYCRGEVPDFDWDDNWNSENNKVVWGYSDDFLSLNKKIDANTLDKIKSYNFSSGKNIIDEADEYGIWWRNSEVEIELSNGKFLNSGTFSSRIPLVAGENITFEKSTATLGGEVVKINASGGSYSVRKLIGSEGLEYTKSKDGSYYICTGIGTCTDSDIKIASEYSGLPVEEIANKAFDGGMYNTTSIVSITVPNSVKTIGSYSFANCENLRSVFVPKSVTFIDEDAFVIKDAPTYVYFEADSQPSEWNNYWVGDLTKENIIWGYKYPYDENGKVEMPQIRFVGMPCNGWFGVVDWSQITGEQFATEENLKFTIEIVGGGALQVGDTLQICRMGTYGGISEESGKKARPKKKKLRRYFEYVITKEDLDKRFITFEVSYEDRKTRKMFTRWDAFGVNDKSIYFRIRRPKGEMNGDKQGIEMTVDAEFSNVVSVRCLSYQFFDIDEFGEDASFYHIRIT